MALPDTFRFSCRPNTTQWYFWDGDILATSASPQYINAPEQWKKTESKWVRSFELRGLKRTLSLPYQFVLDGAAILRAVYLNGSIEGKVYFLIEKWNEITLTYETFFSGEVDLSTYLDGVIYNNGRKAVSATVIEGGISAALEANENTAYEIPLGSDADTILMDGIKVEVKYTYGTVGSGGTKNITVDPSAGPAIPYSDRGMDLYFAFKEGDYTAGTTGTEADILMKNLAFASGSTEQNNEIYEATAAQDVTISFHPVVMTYTNANYSGGNSGPVRLRMSVIHWRQASLDAVRTATLIDINQANVGQTRPYTIPNVTFSRSLATGDRLYIAYDVVTLAGVVPTVGSYGFSYPAAQEAITVGVAFRLPSTDTLAYPYWKVVSKLLEQITGVVGVMQSSFFDNTNLVTKDCRPRHVRLTSGDALRRLTTNPAGVVVTPSIRLTWAELKKDMRYRFGVGIDIRGGKVIIEEAGSFFNSSQIIEHLGEVKSLTYEPAKDYFCTSQKWGYSNDSDGKLNGRDDALTTEIWKWPITRIAEPEDCICPFVTSMYSIEAARANLANKKTTDAQSDNQTFCIETDATPTSGKYNLYRPQNSNTQPSVTGLLHADAAYNLTMSPKRNLLRSGKFIRSALYNLESLYLSFQTTDKNAEMNINLGSGAIAEKADILISTLDAGIFKPILFHVEAITPIGMKQYMDQHPNGCFPFYENGIEYKGYPIEVGIDGDLPNTYQMTLLCTEDTDVLPLISL